MQRSLGWDVEEGAEEESTLSASAAKVRRGAPRYICPPTSEARLRFYVKLYVLLALVLELCRIVWL